MTKVNLRGFFIGFAGGLVLLVALTGGALADRLYGISFLDRFVPRSAFSRPGLTQTVLTEESVVIDVAEKASKSVVTVSVETPKRRILQFNPFGGLESQIQGGVPQDIGSGFIVSKDGLIVTNKHVVSEELTYKVITYDDKEYEVKEIKKDPSNDIAILKIDASDLTPLELGDSDTLKVGQFVIAIGTALGEFRHTVTTGVISGLGRGITAGSAFEGFVERLDDVIQTDTAINPGNSGGPLLNSVGQVIGVNVAVASGAQNIGFAIPIDILKVGLDQFQKTGKFVSRAFLGVEYQMISKESAVLNSVPEGAYITNVVTDSPADKAGLKSDDIITQMDGNDLREDGGDLADIIRSKSPGDSVKLEVWRNEERLSLTVTLSEFSE